MEEVKKLSEEKREVRIADLKSELSKAYSREEIFWTQKVRVRWLKEGDRNTGFFHNSVNSRRRKNQINRMQREDGTWCFDMQEIGIEIESFYQQLFTSSSPNEFEEILAGIYLTMTAQMNEALIQPFEQKEIKATFMSMN